jgi:hypothetical protein
MDAWPGKQYFGLYRFLPFFFVLGAALEFSMINWRVGEVNFCKFFRLLQAPFTLCKHQQQNGNE